MLLYNTLNGQALKYSGEPKILNLVRRLKSPNNLQVIQLTGNDMDEPVIRRLVTDTKKYFMGELIDAGYSTGKPVQMMPMVNIKKDVKYLKHDGKRSVGEGMDGYLSEVFVHINDSCEQNCNICRRSYRQFPCCTAARNPGRPKELELLNIKNFMGPALVHLHILGGNIFNYTAFDQLVAVLDGLPAQKIYYSHYLNMEAASAQLQLLRTGNSILKIQIPAPIREEKLKAALELAANNGVECALAFIIQDEKQFEHAETIISSLPGKNEIEHEYYPFYNGKNLDFFKENVFFTEDEIFESKPDLKDIFANSVVNDQSFGRLTVLSNGHIHANVNAPRLGILGKDSFYDVLYKEMYNGKSWRRIRKHVEPCKRCTFESLCPPISNYTYAIGRNNLCHGDRNVAGTLPVSRGT